MSLPPLHLLRVAPVGMGNSEKDEDSVVDDKDEEGEELLTEEKYKAYALNIKEFYQKDDPVVKGYIDRGVIPIPAGGVKGGFFGIAITRRYGVDTMINHAKHIQDKLKKLPKDAKERFTSEFYGLGDEKHMEDRPNGTIFLQMILNGRIISELRVSKKRANDDPDGMGLHVQGLTDTRFYIARTLDEKLNDDIEKNNGLFEMDGNFPAVRLEGSMVALNCVKLNNDIDPDEAAGTSMAGVTKKDLMMAGAIAFRLSDYDVLIDNPYSTAKARRELGIAYGATIGKDEDVDSDTLEDLKKGNYSLTPFRLVASNDQLIEYYFYFKPGLLKHPVKGSIEPLFSVTTKTYPALGPFIDSHIKLSLTANVQYLESSAYISAPAD